MTSLFVILKEGLHPGVAINAASHLAAGLTNQIYDVVKFVEFKDKNDQVYPHISSKPFVIMSETGEKLKEMYVGACQKNLPCNAFIESMTKQTYTEQLQRTLELTSEEIEFWGVGIVGERSDLDCLTDVVKPQNNVRTDAGVRFEWKYGGNHVLLAGDFNYWKATPMWSENGVWVEDVLLSPGIHQFKFVVDGVWEYDRETEIVNDGSGNINNVVTVEGRPSQEPKKSPPTKQQTKSDQTTLTPKKLLKKPENSPNQKGKIMQEITPTNNTWVPYDKPLKTDKSYCQWCYEVDVKDSSCANCQDYIVRVQRDFGLTVQGASTILYNSYSAVRRLRNF